MKRPAIKQILFLSLALFAVLGLTFVIRSNGQEQRDLDRCLTCHESRYGITEKVQHPLIKEGKCRSCHSSYEEGSHKESVKPVDEICRQCHVQEKLGRSHPIGPGVIDPNTGEDMTCVSTCHDPHGSDFKKLSSHKNNMDLCLSCHDL